MSVEMEDVIVSAGRAQNHEMERLLKHLKDTSKEDAICRLGAWLGTKDMNTINDFWDESL